MIAHIEKRLTLKNKIFNIFLMYLKQFYSNFFSYFSGSCSYKQQFIPVMFDPSDVLSVKCTLMIAEKFHLYYFKILCNITTITLL